MARKNKKTQKIKQYIGYAIAVCGLLAVLSLLLNGVVLTGKITGEVTKLSGFTAIFGWSTQAEVLGSKIITEYSHFSFMGLLIILFPIAGAVLTLLKNKTLDLLAVLLFLVGAIFAFLLKTDFINAGTDLLKTMVNNGEYNTHSIKLGVGAILSGVFSIIGCLLTAVKIYLK